ncbi:MAG: hypothetical protein Fur0010_26990 [Bdellovibrio sp.]
MTDDNDDNDFDEKPDLTRIEKLPEFLHEEDPDIDSQLEFAGKSKALGDEPPAFNISDLEENSELIESENNETEPSPEFPAETPEEFSGTSSSQEITFESGNEWESSDESEIQLPAGESQFESSDSSQDWQSETHDEWSSVSTEEVIELEEQSFSSEDDDSFQSENFEESVGEPELGAETRSEEDATQMISLGEGESELKQGPDLEVKSIPAPPPPPSREPIQIKKREDFQDIRNFGESLSFGTVAHGGQPPFTIKATGIVFKEDAEDIMIILREHEIVNDENEKDYLQMLEHNSLLISQISEYSAIYLSHRLRRFRMQLSVGLSDEINPSKFYAKDGRGLVTKYNLKQNIREHLTITKSEFGPKDVLVTTSNSLDGMRIKRYYDIVSTHAIISEDEIKQTSKTGKNEDEQAPFQLGIGTVYQTLAEDLKNEAFKKEANAVLGVTYQVTPIPSRGHQGPRLDYKITCTGNAVWLENH